MIKTFTLILLIVIIPTIVVAQREITVKDPEIEFRFTPPKGWKTHNDEYYYYVYLPAVRDALVSITYVESSPNATVEEDFDFALKYFYPYNEPGFKIIETGNDTVDEQKAKWIKYQSTYQGAQHFSILYMFIKNGQTFKILGSAKKEDFDKVLPEFVQIIKSVKSRKI
jgi:hypothetical protein